MNIMYYNEKCDICGRRTPGAFMQVWRSKSGSDGLKSQFWCFDCIHGRNYLPAIKKSVTFIFSREDGNYKPNGTGFLVGIESEKDNSSYVRYLVTAKHVLQNEKGDYYSKIYVRLNKYDGKSEYLDIDLNNTEIFTHDQRDVDIAVLSFSINLKILDFEVIPEYIIPDQIKMKQLQISEGDDIFFSGLFENFYGQQRNQPIIRFGKVALMPDEKIEWKEQGTTSKYLDLYLMECLSYAGNSGSPVFFNLLRQQGRKLDEQGPNIHLAGVIMGNFNTKNFLPYDTILVQNIGIAAVTPSYKLHEILYSKKVKENRESAKESMQ
jgi:hypothetical protein